MALVPNVVPATVYRERKVTTGARTIPASSEQIFDLLAHPARHPVIDGSGTVVGARSGNPERLSLGARFGMDMRQKLPYRTSNTVSAFEENRLIEWHHPARHRWRYELEPADGGTRVTETFDWGSGLIPLAYELVGYPERHRTSIDQTLERLHQHFAQ
jgi:hypothetical protein